MNTLDFLCGLATGAFLATAAWLLIVHKLSGGRGENRQLERHHRECLAYLKERNSIGTEQANTLHDAVQMLEAIKVEIASK